MAIVKTSARGSLIALIPLFNDIRRELDVPKSFPPDVIAEAVSGGGEGEPSHVRQERIDATHLPLVTIDPEGSRDLDQALHIERTESGYRVYYAIADVAAHVTPRGAIDTESHKRVETVYCPDMRVGLHPPEMSEGYASLLAGQRTKAALWSIDIDSVGMIAAAKVERAWVTSRHQYSYDQLTKKPPAEARELIASMAAVGDLRRAVHVTRGAVTLPKPTQEVVVDDDGVHIEFRVNKGIEDDNAQISLLTGEAAAGIMLEAGVGVLRTMPPATEGSLRWLRRQAKALGVPWRREDSYSELLTTLDISTSESAAFLVASITLFRGAAWSPFITDSEELPLPDILTHGALAAPYAHVTAPLRRLVDRYGTEICLAHCAGTEVPRWVLDALPALGDTMIGGVKRGKRVDRACIDAVESNMLRDRVGDTFSAVGLKEDMVQIANPAIVARCSGEVVLGEFQDVRLISVDPRNGPRFEVV